MPALFVNQLLAYDQTVNADQIIVTDVPTTDVLTIKTDPRNPRQPLPAEVLCSRCRHKFTIR